MTKIIQPYGLWESPITPASLAQGLRLDSLEWDSDGQTLVWLEGRSSRGVLVAMTADGLRRDLTEEHDVRAEVGYGGGDFTIKDGAAYFAVHKRGQLFRLPLEHGPATPITTPTGSSAAPVVSPDGRWVAYVHRDQRDVDRIALVDAGGTQWPRILADGHDFYMQPRWSPDGKQFAWIAWDHPNMPWDGTWLYLADVVMGDDGWPRLDNVRKIAGGEQVTIFQPEFARDGRSIVYVSEESGWGRIAVQDLRSNQVRWITPDGVEYIAPAWVLGLRTFAIAPDNQTVFAIQNQAATHSIRQIDLTGGENRAIDALAEYTHVTDIAASPDGRRLAIIGSSATTPPRVVLHDLTSGQTKIAARSSAERVAPQDLARCEPIIWKTADGEQSHGLFYPPASSRFAGTGKPPLIVLVHGGPTSQARNFWSPNVQFFATRGYAVLNVNYRGSTGYGRDYRDRLRGNWGICDVQDCVSGARHLAERGTVDAQQMVIMGGSAGGFTVLQTMIDYPEVFAAGICMYGISNQFTLVADTHKFESRYSDYLLGPLPEAAAIYRERSPLFHADKIRRPLAVFQGAIDKVVPQNQSDAIVNALKRNGTPHIYHVYEGEGHGWRKNETIEQFYKTVDDFLRQYVLFA